MCMYAAHVCMNIQCQESFYLFPHGHTLALWKPFSSRNSYLWIKHLTHLLHLSRFMMNPDNEAERDPHWDEGFHAPVFYILWMPPHVRHLDWPPHWTAGITWERNMVGKAQFIRHWTVTRGRIRYWKTIKYGNPQNFRKV